MNIQTTESGAVELQASYNGRTCIIRASHYGIGMIRISVTAELRTKWKCVTVLIVKGHDPELALSEFVSMAHMVSLVNLKGSIA
jgi:hypothetical protein